jgi:hypothetical protein
MKWLLVTVALCAAVLFVPVQGKSLWARGAAKWVARELRAGWTWVDSVGKHEAPTSKPPAHSPAKDAREPPPQKRASRGGIVPQPPKEQIKQDDQAALKNLIAHSRRP